MVIGMVLGKKQKGKIKTKTVCLLSLVMLMGFLAGCSTVASNMEAENSADKSGGENGDISFKAMGRYVEETTDLSDKISGRGNSLYRLSDGKLLISDRNGEFIKTEDNGKSWTTAMSGLQTKMLEEGFFMTSIAVGPDNTVALIRQVDAPEDETADKDGMDEKGADEEADEPETPFDYALNLQVLIIKPDNTEIPVDVPILDNDDSLYKIYVADNGRIFVSTIGSSSLYEVKEDGSSELYLALDGGRPELLQFQGDIMLIDGNRFDGPVLYDMAKEEFIEDEVLTEFVSTNYADRNDTDEADNTYRLYYFFNGEDVLYLAGEKGLYRHVIGGSAMEQIIDGNLCSFGNPSCKIQGMAPLENNEFLALFEGGKIVHYAYDAGIPAKPSEKITVYGLEDNETLRQAINTYQIRNPEVYIEFQIGMDGSSSMTKEDAIKNLNTRIMAGEGPDVLLLDNMPLDSYLEKGLLLDLGPILEEVSREEGIFDNITEAVSKDGKVCAMPCEVRIPVMMADKKYIAEVQDIEDVADMTEALRTENPGKDLLGFCSARGIMRLYAMSCVPAWITADGELNKDAVSQFLKQTKRIYDAQMDGIYDEDIRKYAEMNEYYENYEGASYDDTDDVRTGTDTMSYLGGVTQMVNGAICVFDNFNGFNMMTSIQRTEGFEDAAWTTMKGQGGSVFWAISLLGISTASNRQERAADFVKSCFGRENQTSLYYGLPVNITAFEEYVTPSPSKEVQEDGFCGGYMLSNNDGLQVYLEVYWPDEELRAAFRNCMEEVDTAYFKNDFIEYAVYEEGEAYIKGEKSLEEAMKAIEKKVSIYMAE